MNLPVDLRSCNTGGSDIIFFIVWKASSWTFPQKKGTAFLIKSVIGFRIFLEAIAKREKDNSVGHRNFCNLWECRE